MKNKKFKYELDLQYFAEKEDEKPTSEDTETDQPTSEEAETNESTSEEAKTNESTSENKDFKAMFKDALKELEQERAVKQENQMNPAFEKITNDVTNLKNMLLEVVKKMDIKIENDKDAKADKEIDDKIEKGMGR